MLVCLSGLCHPGALLLIRPFNLCCKLNSVSENEKKKRLDDQNILEKSTITADLAFH